ncbi:MAG: zf-HC2 domain-containing protein [Bryobacteraceae bacterium]|jgi:anti-sigma factor RsiW
MKIHERIEADEVIERYVRRQLGEEERRAFEEHVLDCGACFEKVQEMERFVAGVRYASQSLPLLAPAPRRSWLVPAFAFVLPVLLVLATFWIWKLRTSVDLLASQKQTLAHELEQAHSQLSMLTRPPRDIPAGALPLAILDASRAAGVAAEVNMPSAAREFALWIQLDPESKDGTLGIRVSDGHGRIVETVNGLHKNRYGALAVALPAGGFPPGDYTVVVFRDNVHTALGQYVIRVSAE